MRPRIGARVWSCDAREGGVHRDKIGSLAMLGYRADRPSAVEGDRTPVQPPRGTEVEEKGEWPSPAGRMLESPGGRS